MLVAASGQHILESGTETVGFALREAQRRHEPQRRRSDRVDEDAARPQRVRDLGGVARRASSIPSSSPAPRTWSTPGRPPARSAMCSPTALAFSTRPSRSIASSTASAAAAIGGEPPNVVAWSPRSKPRVGRVRGEQRADREAAGEPLGDGRWRRASHPRARRRTMRRSARCRSAPRRRAAARRGGRRARVRARARRRRSARRRPRPGSARPALRRCPGPTAAASAARSLRGTCWKPAGTGSNGSRLAADQPAASVASVRPWNAPSTHTISCLAAPPRAARCGARA